jgi:hypothetical protein
MKCNKCNAELTNGSSVCPACGATNEKPKSNLVLIVVLAVSCMIVGALVALLVMNLMGPAAPAVTDPAKTEPSASTAPTLPADLKSYTAEDETVIANADVVVATAGEYELTLGELQVFYWSSVYDFLNEYGYYLSYIGMDYTKPLDQQVYDPQKGTTWQQFFLDGAIDTWHRYVVLTHMAEESEYQLSENVQNYLTTLSEEMQKWAEEYKYEDTQAMISHDFGAAADFESYEQYLRLYYTSYEYFGELFDNLEVTDADIEKYYTENEDAMIASGYGKEDGNSVAVRHVLIKPEGGTTDASGNTTYTSEAWEAARTKAQSLLDAWLAGEATEDSFAQMAVANSQDGNAAQGGLYEGITAETNFVEEFLDWCIDEKRQVGDSGLVKTQFGYHIMYFSAAEPIWRGQAESGFRADVVNAQVDATAENFKLETDYEKILLCYVSLSETE